MGERDLTKQVAEAVHRPCRDEIARLRTALEAANQARAKAERERDEIAALKMDDRDRDMLLAEMRELQALLTKYERAIREHRDEPGKTLYGRPDDERDEHLYSVLPPDSTSPVRAQDTETE